VRGYFWAAILRHFWLCVSNLYAEQCRAMALMARPCIGSISYNPLHDIECSFESVGTPAQAGGGDVNLDGGFCDTTPSHSAKPVASFPGAEYLSDPASHPVEWLPRQALSANTSPGLSHDQPSAAPFQRPFGSLEPWACSAQASLDERTGRADEPDTQGSHRQTLLLRHP
jgi:hypothetical protein